MYLIVQHNNTPSNNPYRVMFANDVTVKEAINNSPHSGWRYAYIEVTEANADIIARVINDPENCIINLKTSESDKPQINSLIVGGSSSSPFARKIPDEDYDKTIRPALYRAGTQSLFANL